MGLEQATEKENERRAERERSRKKSPEDPQKSFDYSETSFRQKQSKEIAKIYGSLLDSSSRDRVSSSNYSSNASRVLSNDIFSTLS